MRSFPPIVLVAVVLIFPAQRIAADETPLGTKNPVAGIATSEATSDAPLYGGRDFDTWVHLLKVDLDDSTRWRAVEAIGILGRYGRQEEAYRILAPLVRSKNPPLPQASHHALAGLNEEGVRLLVETLQDADYPHRESIIIALGKAGPQAAGSVDALISIAQGSDEILKPRAFESLLAIGQPSTSIVPLIAREVEQNDDSASTNTIIFRLADSPMEYSAKEPLLIKWLNMEDRQIAHAAAISLGRIGHDTERVRKALRDSLRAYALNPVGEGTFPNPGATGINTKLVLPLLIEVVEEQDLTDPKVRDGVFVRQFADKVGSLGDEGQIAIPILIEILDSRSESTISQVDINVIQSLQGLGSAASDALPSLKKLRAEVLESDTYQEDHKSFWFKKLDQTISRISNTAD